MVFTEPIFFAVSSKPSRSEIIFSLYGIVTFNPSNSGFSSIISINYHI